jgi:predicted nucleic acid-binding protein
LTRRTIVVDASVAIKWVVPEADSEIAEALVGPYRLIAPQLIYAECTNILWKMIRRGELAVDEALKAATVVDDFAIHTVSMRELVPLAIDLSFRLDHAAYDCFYLALALLQNCPMITADAKLRQKVHSRLSQHEASCCVMLDSFASASQ